VIKEIDKGTSLAKIREKVDAKYEGQGYTATDTPKPPKQ